MPVTIHSVRICPRRETRASPVRYSRCGREVMDTRRTSNVSPMFTNLNHVPANASAASFTSSKLMLCLLHVLVVCFLEVSEDHRVDERTEAQCFTLKCESDGHTEFVLIHHVRLREVGKPTRGRALTGHASSSSGSDAARAATSTGSSRACVDERGTGR